MTQAIAPNHIFVAQVAATFGVQGEFKLLVYLDNPLSITDYVLRDAKGEAALKLTRARIHKGAVVVRAEGIADKTAADKLKGLKLYIDRADLPVIVEDDDYYITDLIGLEVIDTAGQVFGKIVGVENFGAGDLLDLQPLDGPRVYIPFSLDAVPEVDMTGGHVVINRDFL